MVRWRKAAASDPYTTTPEVPVSRPGANIREYSGVTTDGARSELIPQAAHARPSRRRATLGQRRSAQAQMKVV